MWESNACSTIRAVTMVLWFFDFGAKFNTDIKVVGSALHKAGKQGGPPCFTILKSFDVGLISFDVGVDHTQTTPTRPVIGNLWGELW